MLFNFILTFKKSHLQFLIFRNGKKVGDGNIEIQFSNAAAKFYCRIYFADNFRQLRKSCLLEDEEIYVRSLSRCVSWAALGGKSGSTFCKTMGNVDFAS
jgi:1-phosphatidylinositol-3-phosphate 5-kinase